MEEMAERQEEALQALQEENGAMKITIQDLQARQPMHEHGSAGATDEENYDHSNRDTLGEETSPRHIGKRPREDNHHEDSFSDTSMSRHHSVIGRPRGRSIGGSSSKRTSTHDSTPIQIDNLSKYYTQLGTCLAEQASTIR
ncbi:hypothetical protein VNO78_07572 [Psophocarpus tetragonolobus]|uniref:Uncharacterized protein n=1 Tax=Psophocarpus tetragonolobus TaxID=3891 RepID=A0AAN9SUF9_PSOTE